MEGIAAATCWKPIGWSLSCCDHQDERLPRARCVAVINRLEIVCMLLLPLRGQVALSDAQSGHSPHSTADPIQFGPAVNGRRLLEIGWLPSGLKIRRVLGGETLKFFGPRREKVAPRRVPRYVIIINDCLIDLNTWILTKKVRAPARLLVSWRSDGLSWEAGVDASAEALDNVFLWLGGWLSADGPKFVAAWLRRVASIRDSISIWDW